MRDALSRFAHQLRAAGVPVSSAELIDATTALMHINIFDADIFRTTLRTTLIKSPHHLNAFEHCFDSFFSHALPDADHVDAALDGAALNPAALADALRPHLGEDRDTRQVLEYLLGDDGLYARINDLERGDIEGASPQQGQFASGLAVLRERLRLQSALAEVRDALRQFFREGAVPQDTPQRRALEGRLRVLEDRLQGRPPRGPTGRMDRGASDREQPLTVLFEQDRARLLDLMRALVRRLEAAHRARQRLRQRGRLDVKRTLRASARTGGTPTALFFRKRVPRRGDLVVLCDVSGSVATTAHVFLAMVHALASLDIYTRLHGFAFVEALEEITGYADDLDLHTLINTVTLLPSLRGASNYGVALQTFKERHGHLVGARTTVMVLGDARNNGQQTAHHVIQDMQRRARRVLWLNPEPVSSWTTGDSEMLTYMPYCTRVFECRTFAQLASVVEFLARR